MIVKFKYGGTYKCCNIDGFDKNISVLVKYTPYDAILPFTS